MVAMANIHAPGEDSATDASSTTLDVPNTSAGVESASEMVSKRPQTSTHTVAETTTVAVAEPTRDESEAPEQAGERLASHLDMLAETVRAIVTRVMQPEAAEPCEPETGAPDPEEPHEGGVASVASATSGRTEYSLEVREQVVAKHAGGASYKTIATEMGMPLTSVQTIVKRAKQAGGVVTAAQRAGRPRVTDESVERTIREIVAAQPRLSAREVLDQVMVAHEGIAVSFETIRRRVRDCRKQLNGETMATASIPPAPLTLQQQLRAGLQQQQAQLEEMDDEGGVEMDDFYSDDGDTPPVDSTATDTEAEMPSTTTAQVRRPTAAGKTRRKRGSEYSPEFRELCVLKHERDGKSYQAIATELEIPPDSVRAIVRKAKRTGSVVTAPRSGRPRKTTDLIDRVILQSVKNSQRSTAKQIQDDLWSIYQVKVSCETIRRRVRDHTKQRLQLVDPTPVPATTPETTNVPVPATANTVLATTTMETPTDERISAALDTQLTTEASPTTTTPSTEEEAQRQPTTRSLKRKRTEYPIDVREKCVALHSEGLGFRKIGEQLNMPHTTVRAIVEKVQRTGSMLPAPRSGRPRKTDEILDKVILQTVKANAKCSARIIQQELETAFDVKVSCETIRRRVKDYMRQKHLFAESTPLGFVVAEEETTTEGEAGAEGRRRAQVQAPVEAQGPILVQQLELQRQQEHERQQRQEAQQRQEQHESMLLMAEITQPLYNVHPHDGMVTTDVRTVPPSLMEMMTAAAAAAAAVSNPHQPPHLSYQPQQLPLMPVPYGFGFGPQLHQPHAQAMQAMLDEALGTQPLEPAHHPTPHAHHPHQLQPSQQPPTSPPRMNEFVLL